MKTLKFLFVALVLGLVFTSCSKQEDDDVTAVVKETVYYIELSNVNNIKFLVDGVDFVVVNKPLKTKPAKIEVELVNTTINGSFTVKYYSETLENGVIVQTTENINLPRNMPLSTTTPKKPIGVESIVW